MPRTGRDRRNVCNRALARIALASAAAVLAWALPHIARAQDYPKAEVVIHGQSLVVDVADTPAFQVQGLGGRRHLGPNAGMLFAYEDLGDHVFWMRGMLIPIDIIWFNNNRVVHIEPSVPPPKPGTPDRGLPTYRAPAPANLVLELAAGRARELGLKVGDRAEFRFR